MKKNERLEGSWNYPTPIRFGAGRLKELPTACMELGIRAPLIVTDGALSKLPIIKEAFSLCRDSGLAVGLFAGVKPNPVGNDVEQGVSAFREGAHDGVVAMGGGSAMDVGKAVGLMVGQDRPIWDFEDVGDNYLRVNAKGMVPVVAVPTTSGTGSEVGRCSVITNVVDARKVIVFHPGMLPQRVICDPEVTLGLPPRVTAGVGMDALAHNLEAFCAPGFHPMADGIALAAMVLIKDSLIRVVENGGDLPARSRMMAASTMGATAFQKGLGAMHALSHPVTSLYASHHGLTNAVVMPYVLVFNRLAIEERICSLARLLGLEPASFEGFLDWLMDLRREIGIPNDLSALGVLPTDLHALSHSAAVDPTASTNPIPLSPAILEELYEAALTGDLEGPAELGNRIYGKALTERGE